MKLYEPVTGTFIIIAVLSLLFSWTLGTSIWNGTMRDCETSNVQLLSEQREGPMKQCGR